MAREITIPIEDHDSNCTQYYLVEYKYEGDASFFYSQRHYDSPIVLVNMEDDTSYTVRITRYCCNGSAATPTEFTFTTTVVTPPTGFGATQDGADVDLEWDNMSVDSYEVQRATNSGFTTGLTDVYAGSGITTTDVAPGAGTKYYRVRSVEGGVASEWATTNITVV